MYIGYDKSGRAKHKAFLDSFLKDRVDKEFASNRNRSAVHHGASRPHMVRIPDNFFHSNEAPYPYILGGQIEVRDEDTNDYEPCTYDYQKKKDVPNGPVKLQLKKLDTCWVYSMPFGKHNAALPEMQYKMPTDIGDKPTKLSYFDILNKK